MNGQLQLRHHIQSELVRYEDLYNKLYDEFRKAPKGSLVLRGTDNYSIALRENGKQYQISLGPQDAELLQKLKNKRYIHEALPILKSRINACRIFLANDKIYDPLTIERNLPKQYSLPYDEHLFLSNDVNPKGWAATDYQKSSYHPEKLIHNTLEGIKTRSKSEAMIGTQLELHKLLPRYEPLIQLLNRFVSADFQFILPCTRRICIWEHLGMIDNPDYTMYNLKKLDDYARSGYVLGYNLIITYETSLQPLTIETIENKINELLKSDQMYAYKK